MAVDAAFVEKFAPDQASLSAAMGLLKTNAFTRFAADPGKSLIWGECQGSGAVPYRLVASIDEIGYKCSCPSRKIPCKHVLALFWRFAERPNTFSSEEQPDWVQDWIVRRRGAARINGAAKASIADALVESVERPVDPEGAAKAQRRRADREASILEGLEQLEIWLDDQLSRGLANFTATADEQCRIAARRLADAKAAGLSNWLDSLPANHLRLPEAERPGWLVEQFGQLALAIEAWRRRDALPAPLAADVQRIVGWSLQRGEVLADPEALRVADRWRVIGTLIELQPDGLRRSEVWFERATAAAPRFAALIEFTQGKKAVGLPFSPGEAFEATFVFYPSAWPLRAVIETRGEVVHDFAPAPAPPGLRPALAEYRAALAQQPWLDRVPLAAGHLTLGRRRGHLALVDETAGLAFPVAESQTGSLSVLLGATNLETCGLWNGRVFEAMRVEGPYGCWYAE